MKHLLCAALIFSTAVPLFADQFAEELLCRNSGALLARPDASDFRKYAPSRGVDILHLKLDVTPDFKARTISGTATLSFKPIAQPLDELRLDGIDLSVTSITSTEKIDSYQVTGRKYHRPFRQSHRAGKGDERGDHLFGGTHGGTLFPDAGDGL